MGCCASNTYYSQTGLNKVLKFGTNNCPTHRQKVGATITYLGDLQGQLNVTNSIVSVVTNVYQTSTPTSAGTVVASVTVKSPYQVELKFDASDKTNLLPGEKYLVEVEMTLLNDDIIIRSFEVLLTDIKGRLPSSYNNGDIPAYINANSTTTCIRVGQLITINEIGVFSLSDYPSGAAYAIVTAISDLEYEINTSNSINTDGVADLSAGETLGVTCEYFDSLKITGLNSTVDANFTIQYWTCNPENCN